MDLETATPTINGEHFERLHPTALFRRRLTRVELLALEELRARWDAGERLYTWDSGAEMWVRRFRRP